MKNWVAKGVASDINDFNEDYDVHFKVNEKCEVIYSHCICPAGNWNCKHSYALYNWINIERSKEVKTDNPQQWHTHSEHLQKAYPKVNQQKTFHVSILI